MKTAMKEGSYCCADGHTNMSLKYGHLLNDFAHLLTIVALLNKQLVLLDEFC